MMGSVIVHVPVFSLNLPSFLPSFLKYWFLLRRPCQHDRRMRSQCGPSSQSSLLLANRITCPYFIKLIKTLIVERQRETKVKLRAQIWKLWATLQGLFQFHSSKQCLLFWCCLKDLFPLQKFCDDKFVLHPSNWWRHNRYYKVVWGRMGYRKHPLYKNLPFSSVAK